ncbi:hypothetical protein [uncultured Thiodictyon sp.]|uniref:hypothetical protein n=1 Tax=uncultured Thiodictyon sp. TaxID=1846217 RepID=UPI0025DE0B5C|nr:hypothetical protein [uncultured Thiodictyon sp.]
MDADHYQAPTPQEVQALLKGLGLTGAQAAALMGLSDGRSVRKYTGGGESPRSMPFSALYALIHRGCGIAVTPQGWREEAEEILRG